MERPLILIVDDESKIRRLLAQNLELEGFDVQTASDGAQALEVYHKSVEKPDLILLDLMLPEIDGMTMLKRLRKSSDVPVIILSAKDERPTVIEGFREGADDFVSKPFYIEELMERIRAGPGGAAKHAPWSTLLKLRNLSAEGSDYCLVSANAMSTRSSSN